MGQIKSSTYHQSCDYWLTHHNIAGVKSLVQHDRVFIYQEASFWCLLQALYKGRVVAQAFCQCPLEDSKILRYLRLLYASLLSASFGCNPQPPFVVGLMHISLNGALDCDVHRKEQPEGFADKKGDSIVWLLKKPFYGTKQGRNHWNRKVCSIHSNAALATSEVMCANHTRCLRRWYGRIFSFLHWTHFLPLWCTFVHWIQLNEIHKHFHNNSTKISGFSVNGDLTSVMDSDCWSWTKKEGSGNIPNIGVPPYSNQAELLSQLMVVSRHSPSSNACKNCSTTEFGTKKHICN